MTVKYNEVSDNTNNTRDTSAKDGNFAEIAGRLKESSTERADDAGITTESPDESIKKYGTRRKISRLPWENDHPCETSANKEAEFKDFLTKSQYFAIKEHYEIFMEELKSDEIFLQVKYEYATLFEYLQRLFEAQQTLLKKVKEFDLRKRMSVEKEHKIQLEIKAKELLITELEITKGRLNDALAREKIYRNERTILKEKLIRREVELNKCENKITQTEEIMMQYESELKVDQSDENEEIEDENLQKCSKKIIHQAAVVFEQFTTIKKQEFESHEKDTIIARMKETIEKMKARISLQESSSAESEHTMKELELTKKAYNKLQREYEIRGDRLTETLAQRDRAFRDLGVKSTTIHALEFDLKHLRERYDLSGRKIFSLGHTISEKEQEIKLLGTEVESISTELKDVKKALAKCRELAQIIRKEKDILHAQMMKSEELISQFKVDKRIMENKRTALKNELNASKEKQDKFEKSNRELEKEKSLLCDEILFLKKKIDDFTISKEMEDKKLLQAERTIFKQREEISRQNLKSKQAANDLYNATKLCEATRSEFMQIKDKHGILSRQLEYIKLIIQEKDDEQKKLRKMVSLLQREKQALIYQLSKKIQQGSQLRTDLNHLKKREQALKVTVSAKDTQIENLEKTNLTLMGVKNNLEVKLSDRNGEVVNLTDKYHNLEINSNLLEKDNQKKDEDIKHLTMELSSISRHNGVLRKKVQDFERMQTVLGDMQNENATDKAKTRCLEEEMAHPQNIHRWRELQQCDPKTFHFIVKNQVLQRRLVAKIKEIKDKSAEIEEKERLICEMATRLKRNQEVENMAESNLLYRTKFNKLKSQLDQATTEVRMYENLSEQDRLEIEKLKEELKKYKLNEFRERKGIRKSI